MEAKPNVLHTVQCFLKISTGTYSSYLCRTAVACNLTNKRATFSSSDGNHCLRKRPCLTRVVDNNRALFLVRCPSNLHSLNGRRILLTDSTLQYKTQRLCGCSRFLLVSEKKIEGCPPTTTCLCVCVFFCSRVLRSRRGTERLMRAPDRQKRTFGIPGPRVKSPSRFLLSYASLTTSWRRENGGSRHGMARP